MKTNSEVSPGLEVGGDWETYDHDDGPPVCQRCGGEGEIMVCIDDICHGLGECIHGDGYATCPNCKGSGETQSGGSLIAELRSLATTKYPLCQVARLMLEMAVECQQGKPVDVTRLLPNTEVSSGGDNL